MTQTATRETKTTSPGIRLTRTKLKAALADNARSAAAVNLLYVSDSDEGIVRRRHGKTFRYTFQGKPVKDAAILERIRRLVIPPAWEQVWICKDDAGHLQVTGYDTRGRKQYRYHPLWSVMRSHTKYFHLLEFGKALPHIRRALETDLARPGLPQEKVLALVVSILQHTGIRIGNGAYEKLYGSFGLSTLKDKHVQIKGETVRFCFKGKKGVFQDLTMRSRRLARLVRSCRDIPGKELFQYYDADGTRRSIDSGMVNGYIKAISGGSFTAKDFRTWTGSLQALQAFRELGCASTAAETKRRILSALDTVSLQLGNTRTVCRKYYVHPSLIEQYECRALEKHLRLLNENHHVLGPKKLDQDERVLLRILESSKPVIEAH